MEPELSALDAYLDDAGVDGYLLDADSETSDQYYLSGFDAPDPFITLYDGETHLLFPRSLEFGRAKRESRAYSIVVILGVTEQFTHISSFRKTGV